MFEESKEYSLYWEVEAAVGYVFAEETVVTINGSSDMLDTEFTEIAGDPTGFWVWTMPT